MMLAMVCWSLVCSATFLFARVTGTDEYGAFFRSLLGPAWFLFDVAYACLVLIMLSVFGAAAGAIGAALLGWPTLVGTVGLVCGIATFAAFGSDSVERLFKYATFFLYAVYALFIIAVLLHSSDRIVDNFTTPQAAPGWAFGGITYAGYNVVCAVVILPALRHLTSRRDAVIAGMLAGPLAMIPALLFYVCMVAYYPAITGVALPSDYVLTQLHAPILRIIFQIMILVALLESGTGSVHAVNERIAGILGARGRTLPTTGRFLISAGVLVLSVFVATRFGLVALIARGYRALAYVFIAVYVVPLLARGAWMTFTLRYAPEVPQP
jgi:uncharacterized membrane protein YkvI